MATWACPLPTLCSQGEPTWLQRTGRGQGHVATAMPWQKCKHPEIFRTRCKHCEIVRETNDTVASWGRIGNHRNIHARLHWLRSPVPPPTLCSQGRPSWRQRTATGQGHCSHCDVLTDMLTLRDLHGNIGYQGLLGAITGMPTPGCIGYVGLSPQPSVAKGNPLGYRGLEGIKGM